MITKHDKTIESFGISLRTKRKAKGLSQEQLALICGLDRTYISGLERATRNPTLKILVLIAEGLNISLPELLSNLDRG